MQIRKYRNLFLTFVKFLEEEWFFVALSFNDQLCMYFSAMIWFSHMSNMAI